LEFRVTGHPKATMVEDDIFHYLVIEYEHSPHIDVFRTTKGGALMGDEGVFEIYRCFLNQDHFSRGLPNVSEAVRQEWKNRSLFTV
jgi:hypothetical protein